VERHRGVDSVTFGAFLDLLVDVTHDFLVASCSLGEVHFLIVTRHAS
jgi:hypothetical protein